MIKEYWVYQRRQCIDPWCLYIVKEYDARHPEATTLDVTVYGEFIQNKLHSTSEIDLHYTRIQDYVAHIGRMVRDAGGIFEDEENEQLDREILRILTDKTRR